MAKFGSALKKELREIFPVWLFFFLSFTLLALTLSKILDRYQVEVYEPFGYFAGSLAVAKAVNLVDIFLRTAWFRSRPLIYATLFNTGIYSAAALVVHHFEQVFKLMWRQHLGFAPANHKVFQALNDPRYWALVAWLVALVFVFCTLRELIRCIGAERCIEMFFGRWRSTGRRCPEDIRKVS